MAARKTFYSTDEVLKFLNDDDFEGNFDSLSEDSSEGEDRNISDDLYVDDKDCTTTDTEAPLLHTSEDEDVNEETTSSNKSVIKRSDFLYASSEEDQQSSENDSNSDLENTLLDAHDDNSESNVADMGEASLESNVVDDKDDSEDDLVLGVEGSGNIEPEEDLNDSSLSTSISPTTTVAPRGRGSGRGRGRRRGCGRGNSMARGQRPSNFEEALPMGACSITVQDAGHSGDADFDPLRVPGPQLPDGCEPKTALDYFRLFFDDAVLDRLVMATNAYAEDKKDVKCSMYRRFKLKELTKEEMLCFIGVFLHLGINSIRNYKQVWNIRSSQVSFNIYNKYIYNNKYKFIMRML